MKNTNINELIGLTFEEVIMDYAKTEIIFKGDRSFMMYHEQDCCEYVSVEDIEGDLSDLEGTPILDAEEVINDGDDMDMCSQWTFYKLRTQKGYITIRWYGESNGHYSTAVDLAEIDYNQLMDQRYWSAVKFAGDKKPEFDYKNTQTIVDRFKVSFEKVKKDIEDYRKEDEEKTNGKKDGFKILNKFYKF